MTHQYEKYSGYLISTAGSNNSKESDEDYDDAANEDDIRGRLEMEAHSGSYVYPYTHVQQFRTSIHVYALKTHVKYLIFF